MRHRFDIGQVEPGEARSVTQHGLQPHAIFLDFGVGEGELRQPGDLPDIALSQGVMGHKAVYEPRRDVGRERESKRGPDTLSSMRARPPILVTLALLAAGAITNLGVALALFATGDLIRIQRNTYYEPVSNAEHVRRRTTCTINGALASDTDLPAWLTPDADAAGWHARVTQGRWAGYTVSAGIRIAAGWPLPCLRYVPPPPGVIAPPAPGAAPLRWFAMTGGRIPRHIYLPGFLANTIIYAAALALPLALFPARSVLRARRGRCPRCGYDTTGCDQCPECGATSGEPAPLEAGHAP